MKKSLLALAVVGAFSGAASAQSSVTIYGVLDLGIARSNGGTAPNPGVDATKRNAWTMQQATPSRLGFRGNEDLGGGLSAQFQIEHRFTADDGQSVGSAAGGAAGSQPFWAGRSYVQLTSRQVGSVYLGREYTPSFWVQLKSDPFGNVTVAQAGSGALYAGTPGRAPGWGADNPPGSASSVRTSNTLGYRTPSFGGLIFNVAGSASENHNIGRQIGASVEYTQGPIWAGVGYDKRDQAPAARNDHQLINVGASYDLRVVKPVVYYARAEVGTNGVFRNDVWMVGLTAPVAGGIAKAMYYKVDASDAVGAPFRNVNDSKKLGVGYDYPLSKRTNLYVNYGYARAQGLGTNRAADFGVKHTF